MRIKTVIAVALAALFCAPAIVKGGEKQFSGEKLYKMSATAQDGNILTSFADWFTEGLPWQIVDNMDEAWGYANNVAHNKQPFYALKRAFRNYFFSASYPTDYKRYMKSVGSYTSDEILDRELFKNFYSRKEFWKAFLIAPQRGNSADQKQWGKVVRHIQEKITYCDYLSVKTKLNPPATKVEEKWCDQFRNLAVEYRIIPSAKDIQKASGKVEATPSAGARQPYL